MHNLTKNIQASAMPVHECLAAEGMFETGMGSVWISRKSPNGKLSVGVFLLDIFCLGVKNALFEKNVSRQQYGMMQIMSSAEVMHPIKPCCLKKLVLEAVAYAENLGFKPHEDYEETCILLQDIETTGCEAKYEFGQNGKPFYIPGPEDSPEMITRVVETLRQRCGADGFDVMTEEDMQDEERKAALAIDDPEEAAQLMEDLERVLPFKAVFEERGWKQLMRDKRVPRGALPAVTVEKLSYAGDFGGILCHLADNGLVCSLTHLRFRPAFALYSDIISYQKRRVKRLKQQKVVA
jgi:hypothetical protein